MRAALLLPLLLSGALACVTVTVEIQTDSWGNEFNWYVEADDGSSTGLADSGLGNNNWYTYTACLDPGYYVFHAYDTFGDGWGSGWFSMSQEPGDCGNSTAQAVDIFFEMAVTGYGQEHDFWVGCGSPPGEETSATGSIVGTLVALLIVGSVVWYVRQRRLAAAAARRVAATQQQQQQQQRNAAGQAAGQPPVMASTKVVPTQPQPMAAAAAPPPYSAGVPAAVLSASQAGPAPAPAPAGVPAAVLNASQAGPAPAPAQGMGGFSVVGGPQHQTGIALVGYQQQPLAGATDDIPMATALPLASALPAATALPMASAGGPSFCTACGSRLQPGAQFCTGCGTRASSLRV